MERYGNAPPGINPNLPFDGRRMRQLQPRRTVDPTAPTMVLLKDRIFRHGVRHAPASTANHDAAITDLRAPAVRDWLARFAAFCEKNATERQLEPAELAVQRMVAKCLAVLREKVAALSEEERDRACALIPEGWHVLCPEEASTVASRL